MTNRVRPIKWHIYRTNNNDLDMPHFQDLVYVFNRIADQMTTENVYVQYEHTYAPENGTICAI